MFSVDTFDHRCHKLIVEGRNIMIVPFLSEATLQKYPVFLLKKGLKKLGFVPDSAFGAHTILFVMVMDLYPKLVVIICYIK